MELCEVTADELESPFRQDSYHEVKYVCTDRGTSSESTSSEIFAPGRDPRRRSFGVTLKPLHRGR